MGPTDKYDAMDKITATAQAIETAKDQLHDYIVTVMDAGTLTWQELADALSISRQAAWERFTQTRLGRRDRANTRS
jgi:hypothetical protein